MGRWLAGWTGILFLTGCSTVERVGMAFLYKDAPFPKGRVARNIPYASTQNPKQQLDLFCPGQTNWPVMIFVHGGGWTSGDKGLRVGGKDVYGNIGRFYAARGIGVAVISYRLQPEADWREQVDDVAAAVAWVRNKSAAYGADTNRIFLAGHSAGAHLISSVALDPRPLAKYFLSPDSIRGVISVSGAGLDLTDAETYRLGESRSYYEERFCRGRCPPGWDLEASPIHHVSSNAPPFLILHAQGEKKSLQRQSRLLQQELVNHGATAKLVDVPGQSHRRMVLVLTRADKPAAPAILDFIGRNGAVDVAKQLP